MELTEKELEEHIGSSLKSLRTAKGLTLDQLATESGVSRAMISRIERGETSPTAILLARLLGPLDQSLSSFFAGAADNAAPLRRRKDQPVWTDPQTGYVRRAVSPSGFDIGVDLVEVELPPGARVSFAPLPSTYAQSEYIWLFEGTLEMEGDGVVHKMEAGDCLYLTLSAKHVFHNRSEARCRYAVVLRKS